MGAPCVTLRLLGSTIPYSELAVARLGRSVLERTTYDPAVVGHIGAATVRCCARSAQPAVDSFHDHNPRTRFSGPQARPGRGKANCAGRPGLLDLEGLGVSQEV